MKTKRLLLAVILVGAFGVLIFTLTKDKNVLQQITPAAVQLPIEGQLPSLGSATAWLNSQPLSAAGLRGKVVLIDFGTYSCINWQRTLPYIRAWAEKYKNRGLVVISVHTPEFTFEHNVDHVRRAVKDLRLEHPIAIDNDYALWQAFDNHYWPALYFVDAQGRIRHHHCQPERGQSERVDQAHQGAARREIPGLETRRHPAERRRP